MDVIKLAQDLIRIPSVTEAELEVGQHLVEILHSLGFSPQRQEVAPNRFNVFAAATERPRLILCSHMDTVPPFIGPFEDSEALYGRGACDAKGIIAAMIAAAERLKTAGVRDFGLLFVVGEETDSAGAKKANGTLEHLGCEYLVVGEPTESKFARASKGALTCFVHFDGIPAHSAYPERGDSAIVKMAQAITEIYRTQWGEDPLLGATTVNVGVAWGGIKPNVIAGEAGIELMFRTIDDPKGVEARLREILARLGGRITRSQGNPPTFMLAPAGSPSTVVAFNTDIPHLPKLGRPVLFGPGSILDAHGPAEKILKRDLLNAVDVYERLVNDLLGGRVRET